MFLDKISKLFFLSLFVFISACGSPLSNQKSKDSGNISFQEIDSNCPTQFPYEFSVVAVCARIEYFDFEGTPLETPIYYRDYRETWEKPLNAKIFFMDQKTFKAIDPFEIDTVEVFSVKMWMPTHGHGDGGGKPILVTRVEGTRSEYLAEGLRFIMNADEDNPWEVRLLLRSSSSDDYNIAEDENIIDSAVVTHRNMDVR